MKEVPMTEVVQAAYDKAKEALRLRRLPIDNIQDICHVAHIYAMNDLYQGKKTSDKKRHYENPIDKLYALFDKGTITDNETYAAFAFCYLKVFEVEGIMKKKSFLAQFEFERKKYIT